MTRARPFTGGFWYDESQPVEWRCFLNFPCLVKKFVFLERARIILYTFSKKIVIIFVAYLQFCIFVHVKVMFCSYLVSALANISALSVPNNLVRQYTDSKKLNNVISVQLHQRLEAPVNQPVLDVARHAKACK